MAADFRVLNCLVSDKSPDGKHYFALTLGDGNLAVGDPLLDKRAFLVHLRPYGRWCRITNIMVNFAGTYAGVEFQPFMWGGYGAASLYMPCGEIQTSMYASDQLEWKNTNWLFDLAITPTAYSFCMFLINYAVSDVLQVMLVGEVW